MDTGYFVLFGLGLGLLAVLIWMLYPLNISEQRKKKEKGEIRGYCPVCGHTLRKGERIRSDVTEIGDQEARTFIKGCPYCLGTASRRRACPVCKKKLPKNEAIMALSNPKVDRHKLQIKGCKKCFSQGFE